MNAIGRVSQCSWVCSSVSQTKIDSPKARGERQHHGDEHYDRADEGPGDGQDDDEHQGERRQHHDDDVVARIVPDITIIRRGTR